MIFNMKKSRDKKLKEEKFIEQTFKLDNFLQGRLLKYCLMY